MFLPRLLAAACVVLAVASCGGDRSADVAGSRQSVVYGDDDREEPFLANQPGWLTEAASTRLLALGDRAQVTLAPSGQVTLDAPTFQERFDVCESEVFSQQPSFAICSGLILSARHVLTASHCTRAMPLAEQVGLGRFYLEPSGKLHPFDATDLHAFTRVVTREDYWDYAWLELAEPLPALAPLRLGSVAVNDAIESVQHGAGLPAKVMSSSVVSVDDDSFLSTLDAFGGASGGPVFSATGELLGVLTSGAPDYEKTAAGCLTAARRMDLAEVAEERAVRIETALQALCAAEEDPELCPQSEAIDAGPGCSIARTSAGARMAEVPVFALSLQLVLLAWGRRKLGRGPLRLSRPPQSS